MFAERTDGSSGICAGSVGGGLEKVVCYQVPNALEHEVLLGLNFGPHQSVQQSFLLGRLHTTQTISNASSNPKQRTTHAKYITSRTEKNNKLPLTFCCRSACNRFRFKASTLSFGSCENLHLSPWLHAPRMKKSHTRRLLFDCRFVCRVRRDPVPFALF